ncbi:MAG TPA: recombination mediator RecR [Planctomycetota bacterium]|jgi:recombination protein RecR|nr:recombination mediator RecR [Planctomycetota bacterium]
MSVSEPIVRLIQELSKLPGIGEKTAERLAFHLLAQPKSEAMLLANAVRDLKEQVKSCTKCYNVSESDFCDVCSDEKRDAALICVVEQTRDLWAIERTGEFRGAYHVLHGHLSPLDGVGPENLTIPGLLDRVRKGGVREVILATNPTTEGDATAFYIQKAIGSVTRVTRIARGISAGSTLEYSDRTVVGDALTGRREF